MQLRTYISNMDNSNYVFQPIIVHQQLKRRILSWSLSLILSIASFILGFPNVAIAQSTRYANALTQANVAQSTASTSLTEPPTGSALELFRNAYEHRYTWDEQFPGYSAEVSIRYEKALYHGLVRINPDLSVATTGINSEAVRQLVVNQLRMVATHRKRVPFEAIHGISTFDLEGTDDTGAVKIREVGDGMDSHYKVQNQKITQVNRVMGQVAVTVDTLGFIKPPEGYLAAHYKTSFYDAQTGEVLEQQDISDNYDKIGKYFLLGRRVIRSLEPGQSDQNRPPDTLIQFNDFQRLSQG